MNRFISYLSASETVDELSSFVDVILSSPEMRVLTNMIINYQIPERAIVCFNHILRTLTNIKSFSVGTTLNAMLPAHVTTLWLTDFNFQIPAVWYKLSNLTRLRYLSIFTGTLDETDCDQLIQLLGNNPVLKKLYIGHISIPQDKIESLIKAIGNLSRIGILKLQKIKWECSRTSIPLGKRQSAFIWEPLKRLQALKILFIDQESVPIDFNSVMSIVQNFYQLEDLGFERFSLRDFHIANLMALLRYRPILVLRLIKSSFSLKSLKKIVSEAERNPKLKCVVIRRCALEEGVTITGDCLNPTSNRPVEAIEADNQAAMHAIQSSTKIVLSKFV